MKQRSDECRAIRRELLNAGIGMNGAFKHFNGKSENLNGGRINADSDISLAPKLSNEDDIKNNGRNEIERKYNERKTTNDDFNISSKAEKPPTESEVECKESDDKSDKGEKMEAREDREAAGGEQEKKTEKVEERKRAENNSTQDKKREEEGRKRTGSMLEKKLEKVEERRKRTESLHENEKPRQMGRRAETRSEQLSQVIGGASKPECLVSHLTNSFCFYLSSFLIFYLLLSPSSFSSL